MNPLPLTSADAWEKLRRYTDARIGLGRAGAALPTGETLGFKFAHAQARDAVHAALEVEHLTTQLLPLAGPPGVLCLQSGARDRVEYLRRPDLGRRLAAQSREQVLTCAGGPVDLALVLADGLSALALERQAVPFLQAFLPYIKDLKMGPLCLVQQGRVAVGEEIGEALRARLVVVLIGERPGLSSPDSMGIYFTYAPVRGLTDERRNCISNVRPAGLTPDAAAEKLAWLIRRSFALSLSGVLLKDEMALPADRVLAQERDGLRLS